MITETTKCNSKEKKVLIVDDEPDVNTVLKNVFDQNVNTVLKNVNTVLKNGFNAVSYDDPILALENFKAGSYDLLILDIKMPEMDGFQLYQKMKKIDSKVKVCFLTASELYHERSRKEEGCCAIDKDLFVRKPIGNEDLIKKINTIISYVTRAFMNLTSYILRTDKQRRCYRLEVMGVCYKEHPR